MHQERIVLHHVILQINVMGRCSRKCKSKFCKEALVPRYGKSCRLFYTVCAGEALCDGLDWYCKIYDNCMGKSKYLSSKCNQARLACVQVYENYGNGQSETMLAK